MRKLPVLLAVAGLASLSAPALAQDEASPRANSKGPYVTAGVGGSWGSSPSTSYSSSGSATLSGTRYNYNATENGTQSLGGGIAADAGLGYDFGNNIRGELTYVLNNYAIGTAAINGNIAWSGGGTSGNIPYSVNGSASGNINTNSVFVSGYYDLKPKSSKSKWTPYVGGGLGWTSVTVPTVPYSATVNINGNSYGYTGTSSGGSASAFGYMAKLGVSYAVSKPADLFAEGVYQGNTSVNINSVSYGALNSFSVRAGVRFRFGS